MSLDEVAEDDDFLTYWNSRARPTTRILGVEVVVPSPDTVPISFDALLERFKDSDSANRAELEELLGELFGEDIFDQWQDRGLTAGMLQVLLAWGMWNGNGKQVTFEEAAELVAEAEAKAASSPGKAVNRSARRASSRARSDGTGRSSKPTSRASTGSAKKTSRA